MGVRRECNGGKRRKSPAKKLNEYREVIIDGAEAVEVIIESPKHGTHIALIDKEDWELVKEHRWYIWQGPTNRTFYAKTSIPHPDGGWCRSRSGKRHHRMTAIAMHRLIAYAPKGKLTDHINHNGLDNRRNNLRIVTTQHNNANQALSNTSKSGYKGVSWNKGAQRWRAYIRYDYKQRHIGHFTDKEEAARAYDAKAKELFGEYAYLNFPDE